MNDETKGLAERALQEADEGAELMWRNVFADIVIEMLNEDETLTRDSIRDKLIARIASDGIGRFDKASLQGALKGLDGKMPAL